MKIKTITRTRHFKLIAVAALATAMAGITTPSAQGAITYLDVIVIDFGKDTDETSGNWNNISGAASAGLGSAGELDPSLNRFSDNAETGVSLTVDADFNLDTGIGGLTATPATVSFSSSGLIPDSAQVDVAYVNHDSVTYTFGGLNDNLSYNIELLSLVDVALARDSTDVTIGGVTLTIDPNDGLVHSFDDLTSIGGEITISFSGTGDGSELFHINALELTAVPEPSSTALLGLGLSSLLLRRRR